jgi:hypothetical protein
VQSASRQPAAWYHANMSVFRSLPDAWAIGQLFPIVPLHRLAEAPTIAGSLADLTVGPLCSCCMQLTRPIALASRMISTVEPPNKVNSWFQSLLSNGSTCTATPRATATAGSITSSGRRRPTCPAVTAAGPSRAYPSTRSAPGRPTSWLRSSWARIRSPWDLEATTSSGLPRRGPSPVR